MAKEFKLQDPGEGIHEAEILDVHVAEGDEIEEETVLLTIETDKAAVEVPSPFSGTVEQIHVDEGEVVKVGDVLITYQPAADEDEREREDKKKKHEEEEQKVEKEEAEAKRKERREVEEESEGEGPVPAAPATRRLARELEVDLQQVEGSGPGGRVLAEDVRAAAGEAAGAPEAERLAEERPGARELVRGAELLPLPDFTRWGEVERVPLRGVRRATAQHMAAAWSAIPHVTHFDVADITELETFRREHAAAVEREGGKLTLTVLFMKAAVGALKEFPRFNASLDVEAEEIILKSYYHIGMAVATERGLLVPVVREVDCKTVTELAVELKELGERARHGEVKREEMQGGTFTVTNPGPIGGTHFTPIINYPQVAILGLGQARLQPAIEGDLDDARVVPRLQLPIGLAFDHRVNDGAEAARFVNAVSDALSDPESLLLTT
ncbi:MAG: biotin/lipoyl-binding protein [Gemmatimonadetes bacterium]|uniref:Dihydrolipoamide acetyltransferase component of pyruvate dehydrogenase complex n=1 Tax=Candidatus Kutchimonas denitrificans TaxID=3056748 RepID=A0AAE4ZAN3_9BACT|nr:biotin/lipoyl-binding protein [Gemmatimonadota bacterium]NIR76704.1 biotin/lipoyl-binding protein [Candidatus Kutchimonas denitrificans]NIS01191.1 biotin/lipoyl-binding protein [Gemmatimonadota bacterium]NIT68230.1 biotin/lipoyl-binding protein [Gemmatimonadota bacterium]NIW75448.1 biotin/lipoyl-binding protein [Gemmatimonadota bacterium]